LPHGHEHPLGWRSPACFLRPGAGSGGRPGDALSIALAGHPAWYRLRRGLPLHTFPVPPPPPPPPPKTAPTSTPSTPPPPCAPNAPAPLAQREAEFPSRASVLDSLRAEARRLEGSLGAEDRAKLDEYLTGIRDLERRMQDERDWLRRPKPKVDALNFGTLQ